MYDKLAAISTDDVSSEMQTGLAATHISVEGELNKLQDKQRAAIERAKRGGGNDRGKGDIEAEGGHLHPDLQDLSFGPLGSEQKYVFSPSRFNLTLC
jgi:hypothetical protein